MRNSIPLPGSPGAPLRQMDPRLVSYNIEMTEVTGGTFWKAYTPGQIAGTEEFTLPEGGLQNVTAMMSLMQVYPPINLYDETLRARAKALGPAWVRVSGTWASKTYYDFDGTANGKAPEGFMNVLTRSQWIGVLDFVKAVGAKLLVSVANCEGIHSAHEPWNPSQAEKLFALSKEYGVPIDAAEFMNEPNMLAQSGAPEGYTPADYARDQDIFFGWLRQNYPETLLVGPCSTGDQKAVEGSPAAQGGGIGDVLYACTTDELMQGTAIRPDVFSYHYYNGISERLAPVMPGAHWPVEQAHSDAYLSVAAGAAQNYAPLRDRYCPGAPMWVTESGDAGGGGDTWASTYLDVLRTLNELGSFARITDGVIFHNTLASSDYGYLDHADFSPRPNYFAVLLWNRLMGGQVYAAAALDGPEAHVYLHSRKDGRPGYACLLINNSLTEPLAAALPRPAARYTLHADTLRAPVMRLNGSELRFNADGSLPALKPAAQPAGELELPPATCTFLVLDD